MTPHDDVWSESKVSRANQPLTNAPARVLLIAALLVGPARLSAQWLDPDRCVTCRDKREHFAAGGALDLLARGPWVARPFRNAAWKRVALTTVVAAGWELIEAGEARRNGAAGQPGYGFRPLDIAATAAGAVALEVVWGIARKGLGREAHR